MQLPQLALAFLLVLVGHPQSASPASIPCAKKDCGSSANRFTNARLTPGPDYLHLMKRLAEATDPKPGGTTLGWRLYPVAEEVSLTGVVWKADECQAFAYDEGDLYFILTLSPESRCRLAAFFGGDLEKVPNAVEVELIRNSTRKVTTEPFGGWSSCGVEFQDRGDLAPHCFDVRGYNGRDWNHLFSEDGYVEVTGPLVVDVGEDQENNADVSRGRLEVHPARLLRRLERVDMCTPCKAGAGFK